MADIFTKAQSLFRRHKYTDVIHLLEPNVINYRRSFKYYYYLGISCLYLRDWKSAWTYLKTAYLINDKDISVATAYGLLLVRRGERQKGLDILLTIVENSDLKKKKGYKKALRGLNLIKKSTNGNDFVELLEQSHLKRYFPVPPKNYRSLYFFLAVVLTISIICFLIIAFKKIPLQSRRNDSRNNLKAIVLEESNNLSNFSNSNYFFILSTKEISSGFNRAKKYLEKFEDNLARREINRILLSNASIDVKQKSHALARMLKRPDLNQFHNSFSYEEVSKQPIIFTKCYIKWSGRLSNLQVNKKHIVFDFLVGYEDRKIVEGIVPAELDFEYLLDESYAYEVLAQILVDSVDLSEDVFYKNISKEYIEKKMSDVKWSLKVVAIRRIQP